MCGCAISKSKHLVEEPVFQARGKVSIVDPTFLLNARFDWKQFQKRFLLQVWGPLGHGKTKIWSEGGDIRINSPELGDMTEVPDIVEKLGPIPFDAFGYWLQGLSSPDFAFKDVFYSSDGRLLGFGQLGWKVLYKDYKAFPVKDGQKVLPRVLAVTKSGHEITMVITHWDF